MLTIEDICREIEAVFAMEEAQVPGPGPDLTCQSRMGLTRCNRHHLHHGKHASGDIWRRDPARGFYFPTKVVTWKGAR